MSDESINATEATKWTTADFLSRLQARVTGGNARLILHSALVDSGLVNHADETLNRGQAESLCMGLINAGGPAFQVGQAIYKEVNQQIVKH